MLILSLVLAPAVQAAGHGMCHGASHAQRSVNTTPSGSDQTDHAHHQMAAAGQATDASSATDSAPGKCTCGCTCLPGHACSSAVVGAIAADASVPFVSANLTPATDALGLPTVDPSPHTRPPISTLR